ncbi:hypothetical protein B0H10DRAFT_473415 [Mycena sp. CBHHK59/15]|nr:hypothetical protein B0H10DRAFT_473415 [Mycena sp. CBHHK59/15]
MRACVAGNPSTSSLRRDTRPFVSAPRYAALRHRSSCHRHWVEQREGAQGGLGARAKWYTWYISVSVSPPCATFPIPQLFLTRLIFPNPSSSASADLRWQCHITTLVSINTDSCRTAWAIEGERRARGACTGRTRTAPSDVPTPRYAGEPVPVYRSRSCMSDDVTAHGEINDLPHGAWGLIPCCGESGGEGTRPAHCAVHVGFRGIPTSCSRPLRQR